MKVLYLVHQFYPEFYMGTEKFVFNTARMVQKNGNKVKVITYSPQDENEFQQRHGDILYKEYVYRGVPVLAFRHLQAEPDFNSRLSDPQLLDFAEGILAHENPDLVHVGHPMRVSGFVHACMKRGIPYIVTLTDFYLQCMRGIMVRSNQDLCDGPQGGLTCEHHCQIPGVGERLATAKAILASARFVVAPSQFVSSMLQKEFKSPVKVLPHGMSYSKVKRNQKVYNPGDPITFFYGGSISPHKGVHLIIEAAKKIESDRLRVKIFGSGDRHYTEMLRSMAGDDARIEFCGVYTEADIQEIYQHVDVAIVPSVWYENYPLALHEALVSGIPAVVSNVGGMAEKIQDDHNGYTFRLGDAGDLADKMLRILMHPTQLNLFKANLSKYMIPTIEQEVYAYEQIYKSII